MAGPILSTFALIHLILTALTRTVILFCTEENEANGDYILNCSITFVISHLSESVVECSLLIYLSPLVSVSHCCNYRNFVQINIPRKHKNQDSEKDSQALESPL